MTVVHDYTPSRARLVYVFGAGAPAVFLKPGDGLRVWTQDCFGGVVRRPDDLPSKVCQFPYLNPLSGPFYVDGAEPGDTLALHFVSITPARDWAVSATFPHFGALTSTATTATLQPALEERVWVYTIDNGAGTVRYRATRGDYTVDLPLDPMLGTVGVAPGGFEARSSLTADRHGGNMDTPKLRAGTTLYLGVNVHGGLFALGDGHARQGHGELCGVGIECAMTTTLVVDVIKQVPTPWPRIETADRLLSVGCARPLDDAYRIAHHDLVTWTAAITGLDDLDAYQLISQAGEASVGNVCDPNYTIAASIAKRWLPAHDVYHDTHHRLRHISLNLPPSPDPFSNSDDEQM